MRFFCLLVITVLTLASGPFALAAELDDFRKALADLQPGARYRGLDYLHCVGAGEECRRLEGSLGSVLVQVELAEGIISGFQILAEGVRLENDLIPMLREIYGPGEKRSEAFREERIQADQELKIPAAAAFTCEWRTDRVRITLFSQDAHLLVRADGSAEVIEPMKTYVSGSVHPDR